MKTALNLSSPKHAQSGLATLAILILLMAASAFSLSITGTLRNLDRDLKFLDVQHRKHWSNWNPNALMTTNLVEQPATNAAPALTSGEAPR